MRRVVAGVALAFAVTAADASAALATRDCDSRGEGTRPVTRLVRPGDLQLGPVAFIGLHRIADRDALEGFRTRDGYSVKTPLAVRAGRVVTVSVSAPGYLTFVHGRRVRRVRFIACDRDEPAFSYDGKVGGVTGFPGGFFLREPACVAVRVAVRGGRRYSALVPFGTGGCGLQRFATAA